MYTDYDVITIGSGCSGMSASIYTSRAGFETLLLERKIMGGELVNRQLIENYPGFAGGVMGPDLAAAMVEQAESAGVEFEIGAVVSIKDKGGFKIVKTEDNEFTCKGIILATGSLPRFLNVPGERELGGKGVFYCATCDGPQCAGKPVMVAGGGDSGLTEALHLAKLECKVTVVEFMAQPKASKILQERVEEDPNIEIICNHKTNVIHGTDWVASVEIEDRGTAERRTLDVQGVYIRVGQIPNTEYLTGLLKLTPSRQVLVNERLETAIAGICAAGDIRTTSPQQIATGVGDGVTAAMTLGRYLNTL